MATIAASRKSSKQLKKGKTIQPVKALRAIIKCRKAAEDPKVE
jgi:hypothetical protein